MSVTSVMIPRVPSLPQRRRASWYPEASLIVLVPARTISPSALTNVRPRTKSLVAPYLTALIPEALVATIPPISAASAEPGEQGKKKPYLASSSLRALYTHPAWTSTQRSPTETLRTLFILDMSMTMPPLIGTADPHSPVPAPRGTTGMSSAFAIFMISETCSVVLGWMTISGVLWNIDASKPYA